MWTMTCLTSTITGMSAMDEIERCLYDIAQGNGTLALEKLYKYTKDMIYGYALSMLKNTHDAEDVLHDTYISIYHSASRYSSRGKPMAWIITITRNLCLDKLRMRSRITDLPEENWEQHLDSSSSISIDDKLMIEFCINSLTSDEREILLLHVLSGLKHREISEMTNRPIATILSKYHRALKKLRTLLKEEDR